MVLRPQTQCFEFQVVPYSFPPLTGTLERSNGGRMLSVQSMSRCDAQCWEWGMAKITRIILVEKKQNIRKRKQSLVGGRAVYLSSGPRASDATISNGRRSTLRTRRRSLVFTFRRRPSPETETSAPPSRSLGPCSGRPWVRSRLPNRVRASTAIPMPPLNR